MKQLHFNLLGLIMGLTINKVKLIGKKNVFHFFGYFLQKKLISFFKY